MPILSNDRHFDAISPIRRVGWETSLPELGIEEPIDNLYKDGQLGLMIKATISETKNRLSELLARVKNGETLIILDRKNPVARVESLPEVGDSQYLCPPVRKWNPRSVLDLPIAVATGGEVNLVDAVRRERESGW